MVEVATILKQLVGAIRRGLKSVGSSGGNHGVREQNGSMLAQCKDASQLRSAPLSQKSKRFHWYFEILRCDTGSAPPSRIFGSNVKDTDGDRWPTKKQKTDAQKPVPSDCAYQGYDTARLVPL